ncbi:unnamed protein product, partial [Musa textilis]
QGGVGCSTIERVVNSRNSILMQGLACGRWIVRGHPKVTEGRRHGALKLSLQRCAGYF